MSNRVVHASPALPPSAPDEKAVVSPISLPLRCRSLLAALTVLPACAAIGPDFLGCSGDPSVAVSFQ